MGSLTLSDMRSETKFLLRNRNDNATSDTRLNRWINAAYYHMCLPSVHSFREMQTTADITLVSGTVSYSINEATLGFKIVGFRGVHHYLATAVTATAEKRTLHPRNIRWFDRRTLTSGSPSVYAIDGETLYVSPVPDSGADSQILRLRAWQQPAALSGDTDVTVLPDWYDEVLLVGAQWMGERALGYRDKAEMTKQDYVSMLNEGPEQEQMEAEDWDFQVDVSQGHQGEMV